MTVLQKNNQVVTIDNGELIGYRVDSHEFIHQKGSPGWGSSDTEMFPIIGPVDEADFLVKVPKGNAVQDQHGHFRLLPYELVKSSETSALFRKEYQAGTPVKNKKYPEKSPKELLTWPYSFQVDKQFNLLADGLEITFAVTGDHHMPFMLGYHPAFKLHSTNPLIKTADKELTLGEVLAVGSRAYEIPDCQEITLKDKKELTIRTEGFKHFMCWTEVSNMVCIEPITFYPYAVAQRELHQGFQHVTKEEVFQVRLHPKG